MKPFNEVKQSKTCPPRPKAQLLKCHLLRQCVPHLSVWAFSFHSELMQPWRCAMVTSIWYFTRGERQEFLLANGNFAHLMETTKNKQIFVPEFMSFGFPDT